MTTASGSEVSSGAQETYAQVQADLLRIGSGIGLEVWVARNDRRQLVDGVPLGEMSGARDSLPRQFEPETMRTIELIDVLWLDHNSIEAAFEIEHTTAVYSGLLRMSDLLAMQPNLDLQLYVVAPERRRRKVERELSRPTFRTLKRPLHETCLFLSYESISELTSQFGAHLGHINATILREFSVHIDPRPGLDA